MSKTITKLIAATLISVVVPSYASIASAAPAGGALASRTRPRAISNMCVGAGAEEDGGGAEVGAGVVLARESPRVRLSVERWPHRITTAATMVGRTTTRVPTMRIRLTSWTIPTTLSPSVAVRTMAALHTIAELTRVLAMPT